MAAILNPTALSAPAPQKRTPDVAGSRLGVQSVTCNW